MEEVILQTEGILLVVGEVLLGVVVLKDTKGLISLAMVVGVLGPVVQIRCPEMGRGLALLLRFKIENMTDQIVYCVEVTQVDSVKWFLRYESEAPVFEVMRYCFWHWHWFASLDFDMDQLYRGSWGRMHQGNQLCYKILISFTAINCVRKF